VNGDFFSIMTPMLRNEGNRSNDNDCHMNGNLYSCDCPKIDHTCHLEYQTSLSDFNTIDPKLII
jgi:hypothetical protein